MTARPARHSAPEVVELALDDRTVRVTNASKPLFPSGFTKGEMIDYYRAVSAALLPHIAGRPLTLRRFPDGLHGNSWFQTECRDRPAWMSAQPVRFRTGNVQEMCVVDDVASLVWVANLATIELHPLLMHRAHMDRPLVLVFDLDPGPPAGLAACARVALRVREMLDGLGLGSLPKASGSKGVHVYVPLNGTETFETAKPFARAVAARLAAAYPDEVVDVMRKAARVGKVFVDWSQNDASKSTVAPYSLRARVRPVVSAPLTWHEVERVAGTGDVSAFELGPRAVLDRIERDGDIFRPVLELAQPLPAL